MSADIVVTMDITLTPQAGPHFVNMGEAALQETRKFPGCLGVRILLHKDDAHRFLFIEQWANEQAYRDYIAWRSESGQFQALEAMSMTMKVDIWPQLIAAV